MAKPKDSKSLLSDILLHGINNDIFNAEEALAILRLIGKHMEAINKLPGIDLFCGTLQRHSTDRALLFVSKLSERSKYPVRSVPAALKLLNEHAGVLKIQDRGFLIERLLELDPMHFTYGLETLSDAELTGLVVQHYTKSFVESIPREALRQIRNTVVAHNGQNATALDIALHELDDLLDQAKRFLGLVGRAYLSTVYEDSDGKYFFDFETGRASLGLRRLLVEANIIKNERKVSDMLND
jgi:hypothetical protein